MGLEPLGIVAQAAVEVLSDEEVAVDLDESAPAAKKRMKVHVPREACIGFCSGAEPARGSVVVPRRVWWHPRRCGVSMEDVDDALLWASARAG